MARVDRKDRGMKDITTSIKLDPSKLLGNDKAGLIKAVAIKPVAIKPTPSPR